MCSTVCVSNILWSACTVMGATTLERKVFNSVLSHSGVCVCRVGDRKK